jgi:hypothetical protein
MDAAKGLAKRMAEPSGSSVEAKIRRGFLLCTCREPSETELQRLVRLNSALNEKYAKDDAAARKLAGNAESAALVMLANTLLNLDETISRT